MYNPRNFCFYSSSASVSFDFETRIMSTCMSTSRSNYFDMSIWKKHADHTTNEKGFHKTQTPCQQFIRRFNKLNSADLRQPISPELNLVSAIQKNIPGLMHNAFMLFWINFQKGKVYFNCVNRQLRFTHCTSQHHEIHSKFVTNPTMGHYCILLPLMLPWYTARKSQTFS